MNASESILIVEDEAIVAMDLQQQLEGLGYGVIGTTGTGEEAIAMAREHKPGLVLMDIVLRGEMDGIETARYINRAQHSPVVYLTAFSDEDTVKRAAETSPYGYITKPYALKELRATIEVALYKGRVERRLYESEQWFSSTLKCVRDGVIATDMDGRITFMNPVAETITGWAYESADGKREIEILRFMFEEEASTELTPGKESITRNSVIGIKHGAKLKTRDDNLIFVDYSAAPIRADNDKLLGSVIVIRDATERIRQEELLRESEERFYSAFSHAPSGMALVSLDGRFLQVNNSLCNLLGYEPGKLAEIRHNDLVHPEDLETERVNLYRLFQEHAPSVQYEFRYNISSGRKIIWVLAGVSLLREKGDPTCFLFQIYDLTERKHAEQQLTQLAFFDSLTGLANRSRLGDELSRTLAHARRSKSKFAVVFMDLDRFKQVNDSLGHEAGDELLKGVSQRLEGTLRETDCIARLGGDEFVIILQDIESPANIMTVLEKVRQSISVPFVIAKNEVVITPSMGVSIYPDDGEDTRSLLRNADSALFTAKADGRNRICFFQSQLAGQADERLYLETALHQALKKKELLLYYQPIIRLEDGKIEAFEALIRWQRGDELISAGSFIPVAEEIGLIEEIGTWIINEACRFAAKWSKPYTIHINCSAQQFKSNSFVETVIAAIKNSKIQADRICLEITESIMMINNELQQARFMQLKDLGVRFSIDDYGTGYSSLSYLKRYEPETLKIDRYFINDLVQDPNDAAIVSATIAMAHSLGARVVAEGVEDISQEEQLRIYGCDFVQGYYYGRPVPEREAVELINQDSAE